MKAKDKNLVELLKKSLESIESDESEKSDDSEDPKEKKMNQILSVFDFELDGVTRLIKLRNTYGETEWTGAW
jgi:hypothetical protein